MTKDYAWPSNWVGNNAAQPCYLLPLLLHPWTPCPSNGKKTLKDSVAFHILQARLCGCTTLFSPPIIFFTRRVVVGGANGPPQSPLKTPLPSQKWSKEISCSWSQSHVAGPWSNLVDSLLHHLVKSIPLIILAKLWCFIIFIQAERRTFTCSISSQWKWHLIHPLLSWC